MKRVALYFGSFNPVHRGHIALAEWVLDCGLCDETVLIVSPHNPVKKSADLAPEFNRYEMCELACAESKHLDRILVSAVEFTLDKPSYTINTLRYLNRNFGAQMRFSLLIGADNMAIFDKWRAHDEILRDYEIMVYPRRGYADIKYADRVRYLADAPLFDISATAIRDAVGRGESIDDKVSPAVAKYIAEHRLWSPMSRIASLNESIAVTDTPDAALFVERGMWHYRIGEYALALADFRQVLATDAGCVEAKEFIEMTEQKLHNR